MIAIKSPRLTVFFLILPLALLAATPDAEAANRGLPSSMLPGTLPLDKVELREMPTVDTAALLAEDARRESAGAPVPTRYATLQHAAFSTEDSGTWEELADGSRLWRLRIASPGALSLSLGLSRFELPAGAMLWLHDPDGAHVQGPYTAADRNAVGGLWTAMVLGDEAVAELRLPPNAEGTPHIEISSVSHGYRFFGKPDAAVSIKRGTCNVNVVCPEGNRWRDQIRSVAVITFTSGGTPYVCTAQLVNNTAEDDTPYLLTAQHCIDAPEVAPTIVAYWNYQSPNCDDVVGGSLTDSQSGATFVASSPFDSGSDFALVELDEQPDASYNVFFAGWDAQETPPQSSVCLHHPSGDEKSISYDFEPVTVTSYLENASPGDGNYLRVGDWDVGTTEPGSSGACLYDETSGLCVGTLSGGYAACGNDLPDWFARFYSQYTGDGTPDTRLSDWLDPLDTGTLWLEGKNQAGQTTTWSWLIPAAASAPGVGTSNWKTQINVVNLSTGTRAATIHYVADGQQWPGQVLSGPHEIAPGSTLYVDDPLLSMNPTTGLIFITVDGDGTVAFSRTYNLNEGGATFGQGIPGVLLENAVYTDELILPFVNNGPSTFRTNLGLVQTSTGTYQVIVKVYSSQGGLLAQKTFTTAKAWRQINDLFTNMGIGGTVVDGGWIRVTLVSGYPAYWTTYASVIDAQTDDPTYVVPTAP